MRRIVFIFILFVFSFAWATPSAQICHRNTLPVRTQRAVFANIERQKVASNRAILLVVPVSSERARLVPIRASVQARIWEGFKNEAIRMYGERFWQTLVHDLQNFGLGGAAGIAYVAAQGTPVGWFVDGVLIGLLSWWVIDNFSAFRSLAYQKNYEGIGARLFVEANLMVTTGGGAICGSLAAKRIPALTQLISTLRSKVPPRFQPQPSHLESEEIQKRAAPRETTLRLDGEELEALELLERCGNELLEKAYAGDRVAQARVYEIFRDASYNAKEVATDVLYQYFKREPSGESMFDLFYDPKQPFYVSMNQIEDAAAMEKIMMRFVQAHREEFKQATRIRTDADKKAAWARLQLARQFIIRRVFGSAAPQ
jgi:hypothetical protein